jgi:hypothetical protein
MELYFEKTCRKVPQFLYAKKAIRIMEGRGNRFLCTNLFKKLQILPLTTQHILSCLIFVVQNKNLSSTNIKNHNIDTGQRNHLYLPQVKLVIY